MRQAGEVLIVIVLGGTLATAARAAFDARPPLAHTGGFGEQTCRLCHFDGPAKPAGTVSLGGLPDRYQPGAVYALELILHDSTATVGGFQLAARVATGAHAGTQAGTLCALDSRVAITTDSTSGVQYASHAGSAPKDSLRWPLEWRAPSGDIGGIAFHVAANSANDDDSPLGDAILLFHRELRPDTEHPKTSGVRRQISDLRNDEGGCRF